MCALCHQCLYAGSDSGVPELLHNNHTQTSTYVSSCSLLSHTLLRRTQTTLGASMRCVPASRFPCGCACMRKQLTHTRARTHMHARARHAQQARALPRPALPSYMSSPTREGGRNLLGTTGSVRTKNIWKPAWMRCCASLDHLRAVKGAGADAAVGGMLLRLWLLCSGKGGGGGKVRGGDGDGAQQRFAVELADKHMCRPIVAHALHRHPYA